MNKKNFTYYGKSKSVPDTFQAYLVKDAYFTHIEEYPILQKEMISSNIPKKIMPFSKAINYKGNLSNTFICMYEPDKDFERIRKNPYRYINFFKRTAGIIGFDFSIHSDMPLIKQKSQINDNLSLSYFYGSHGIPIIPNIRCGVDELHSEFYSAIPKNSLIAIGTHGFIKYKYEKYSWYCFLKDIIDNLSPSGIIVYGSLSGKLFDSFKEATNFYYYTPWIYTHGKEGCKNVS